jgi:predicted HD superfamily hydrolase involved in NAD metabolism
MSNLEDDLRKNLETLPEALRQHVERVVEEADRLAALHGVDREKVRLAALGHDLVRAVPPDELLRMAREVGLNPSDVEEAEPVLLHGPIAARLLPERFGLDDPDVLQAVEAHTTGRPGMSAVAKILFVADKAEPVSLKYFPDWSEVWEIAQSDLDGAVLKGLDLSIQDAIKRGWLIHPQTIAARNHLLRLK